MSTTADDRPPEKGITFTYEQDDGTALVTAIDMETGIAASGETKPEAVGMLAEALELHAGNGEPITDEDAFLREIGVDPADIDDDPSPPPWLD